ncbi:MAG: L,D-transpeptidase Cds6 family protein [Gammaproteobacteria bacterium]
MDEQEKSSAVEDGTPERERTGRGGKGKLYPVKRSSGEIEYLSENEIAALNAAKHERHEEVRQRRKFRKQRDHALTVVVGGLAALGLYISFGGLWGGSSNAGNEAQDDNPDEQGHLIVSAPAARLDLPDAVPRVESAPPNAVVADTSPPEEESGVSDAPGTEDSAEDAGATLAILSAPPALNSPVERSPVPDVPPPLSAVKTRISAWAQAWSIKELEGYFASYASTFTPPGGLSLEQWRAQRTERIRAPEWISVEAQNVRVAPGSEPGSAVALFRQSYLSPGYSDTEDKIMDLAIEDGQWRITRERVVGGD